MGHSVPAISRQQPRDVFEHEQPGSCDHSANSRGDVIEQPPFVADACAAPGRADWLAREPGEQDVCRLYRAPVDCGDVTEVRHVREPVREDRGRARVVVGDPGELAAQHGLHGHAETLVAAAK
jgi:hypothetical protein